jgi:site-specific recombinase XerD
MHYFFADPFFRNLKFIPIRHFYQFCQFCQFCQFPHKVSLRSKKCNRSLKEFCCIKEVMVFGMQLKGTNCTVGAP